MPERAPAAAVLLLRAPRGSSYWIERDPLLAYSGFPRLPGGRVVSEERRRSPWPASTTREAQRRAGAVRSSSRRTGVLLARPAGPVRPSADAEERARRAPRSSRGPLLHHLPARARPGRRRRALTPAGRWSRRHHPRGSTAFLPRRVSGGRVPLSSPASSPAASDRAGARWAAWESGAVLLPRRSSTGGGAARRGRRGRGDGPDAAAFAAATARCGRRSRAAGGRAARSSASR